MLSPYPENAPPRWFPGKDFAQPLLGNLWRKGAAFLRQETSALQDSSEFYREPSSSYSEPKHASLNMSLAHLLPLVPVTTQDKRDFPPAPGPAHHMSTEPSHPEAKRA